MSEITGKNAKIEAGGKLLGTGTWSHTVGNQKIRGEKANKILIDDLAPMGQFNTRSTELSGVLKDPNDIERFITDLVIEHIFDQWFNECVAKCYLYMRGPYQLSHVPGDDAAREKLRWILQNYSVESLKHRMAIWKIMPGTPLLVRQ